MNKRIPLTAAGIVLAILIAFGCLAFSDFLLRRQSEKLLNSSGSVYIPPPDESALKAPALTVSDIADICLHINENLYSRPHEPLETQLSMEQAINSAVEALTYLYEAGVIPDELKNFKFSQTQAVLSAGTNEFGQTQLVLNPKTNESSQTQAVFSINADVKNSEYSYFDPKYSFWDINFINDRIKIDLRLHAQTGKIFSMSFYSYIEEGFYNIKPQEAAEAFAAYLGFDAIQDAVSPYALREPNSGFVMLDGGVFIRASISDKNKNTLLYDIFTAP